jgi:hypothetical protein
MPYTRVLIQSVKGDIQTSGLQIILVAQGADLPDVPDIAYSNGVPFDPLVLRYAARALLDRLNANLLARAAVQLLVGTDVDVTSPLPAVTDVPDPPGPI